jgi:hypothetical protein
MDQRHAFNVVKSGEFPATDLAACALLELIERHDKLCEAVLMMLTEVAPPNQARTARGCAGWSRGMGGHGAVNHLPTRAEALAVWTTIADAGYVATITAITHESMAPSTVYQLSVGPKRMRFTLEDLIEVKANTTLPLDGANPCWQVSMIPEPRP